MAYLLIPLLFLVSCSREQPKDLKENRSQLFINEKIISTKLFENSTGFKNRFYDFEYKSNSLLIRGFVTLPRGFDESKKYPVIIYNRGGNRDLGMIDEAGIFFDNMSKDKYIVFASQYRGSKGSQGQDQVGGDDIYDVINLVDIIKTYKFVDSQNIFNIGISRGAMMTYIGMKHGLNFNAAVVWGGVTDVYLNIKNRPRMEWNVFSVLIPNYSQNKKTELESRSVIYWPEKVQTPLLFLHGEDDWRVRIEQPKLLIEKLKQLKKPYQFKFYKNGTHDLYSDRKDVFERIHSFFDEYMR